MKTTPLAAPERGPLSRLRRSERLRSLCRFTDRLWRSVGFFPALLLLFVLLLLPQQPVYGVMVLGGLCILLLLLCQDLMAPLCPFLMAFLLSTQCYEQLDSLLPCALLVPPLLLSLLWHLLLWPVSLRPGRCTGPLLLVSAATALGGLGTLSLSEALDPLSLYYSLGLGPGMLLLYLLFRAQLGQPRAYDLRDCFARLLCTLGLSMAAAVLLAYARELLAGGRLEGLLYLPYRNFAASVLLLALPMPFYLCRRDRRQLLCAAVMALALLLSGSRSALLFGCILLLLCCWYLTRIRVLRREFCWLLLGLAALGVLLAAPALLQLLLSSRDPGELQSSNSHRLQFLQRALRDFLDAPLFGVGLGSRRNADVFPGVAGSMVFYHNSVAQVLGSMGLLGAVAYGRLLWVRVRLLRGRDPFLRAVGLSYLGMMLLSLCNPGAFCPFPNAALLVMLFALAEEFPPDAAGG